MRARRAVEPEPVATRAMADDDRNVDDLQMPQQARPIGEDKMMLFRGIVYALLFSIPLDALIVLAVWWLTR